MKRYEAALLVSLLCLCIALIPSADAQKIKEETHVVVVTGCGIDYKTALKNAFSNAVESVVGIMVHSQTLVENFKLIEDKILTLSEGYIESYEELSKKQEEGLFYVKIKACVKIKELVEQIKAHNISISPVSGKDLYAKILTKVKTKKEVKQMLKAILEGFPLNLLRIQKIGELEVVEEGEEESKVKISAVIFCDLKAYKTFQKRLATLLDEICEQKGEFTTTSKFEDKYKGYSYWDLSVQIPEKKAVICMVTAFDRKFRYLTWNWWLVPKYCLDFFEVVEKGKVKVQLLDKDDFLIAQQIFYHERKYEQYGHGGIMYDKWGDLIKIAPFHSIWISHYPSDRCYVGIKKIIEATFTLTNEEIGAIDKVKVELPPS